jgi:hypothetical protein
LEFIAVKLGATSVLLGLILLVTIVLLGGAMGWFTPYDSRYALLIALAMIVVPVFAICFYVIWSP